MNIDEAQNAIPRNKGGICPTDGQLGQFSQRRAAQHGVYGLIGKRVLDIFAVLLLAPVVVPVILLLAVLTCLDGGNPFYSQLRVGLDGRTFRMWKLRSMRIDADADLATYLANDPEMNQEWRKYQKLKNDPRITKIGRYIRKSSLDELPQLWNVLLGEMSVVGPRPIMPSQTSIYPGRSYYLLRPGITGNWQVFGRNETNFGDRARYDAEYLQNMSLATDMVIVLNTVPAVIGGTGY